MDKNKKPQGIETTKIEHQNSMLETFEPAIHTSELMEAFQNDQVARKTNRLWGLTKLEIG